MTVAPYRQVARITGPMPALPFGLKPAGGPGLRLAALAPVATIGLMAGLTVGDRGPGTAMTDGYGGNEIAPNGFP